MAFLIEPSSTRVLVLSFTLLTSSCPRAHPEISASGRTVRLLRIEDDRDVEKLSTVFAVDFSPDGKMLVATAGTRDCGGVYLWNIADRRQVALLGNHTSYVYCVDFSADGKVLASGSNDGTIRLWDISSGKTRWLLKGSGTRVESVAFSPNATMLASDFDPPNPKPLGSELKGKIRIWNPSTGADVATFAADEQDVEIVAFSPKGNLLASGGTDQAIRIWDVFSRRVKHKLVGHTSVVCSLDFSPDGEFLASGDLGSTVKIWNVDGGKLEQNLKCNTNYAKHVAYSPDGKRVAVGDGKWLLLFDVLTGKKTDQWQGHPRAVTCAAFSPDGHTLAAGGWDNSIRLWTVMRKD